MHYIVDLVLESFVLAKFPMTFPKNNIKNSARTKKLSKPRPTISIDSFYLLVQCMECSQESWFAHKGLCACRLWVQHCITLVSTRKILLVSLSSQSSTTPSWTACKIALEVSSTISHLLPCSSWLLVSTGRLHEV